MLDFPNNPTLHQVFKNWQWKGARWGCIPRFRSRGMVSPPVFVGPSPPSNAVAGDLWWNTVSRALSINIPQTQTVGPFSWDRQQDDSGTGVFSTAPPRIDIGPLNGTNTTTVTWYGNAELVSPNPFMLSVRLQETSPVGAGGRMFNQLRFNPAHTPPLIDYDTINPTGGVTTGTWPSPISRLEISMTWHPQQPAINRSFAVIFNVSAPAISPWIPANWAVVDGRGVTDGSNSAPGLVGESQSRDASLSGIGGATDDLFYVLSPGDWDCSAHGRFTSSGPFAGGNFNFQTAALEFGPGPGVTYAVLAQPIASPHDPAADRFTEIGVPFGRLRSSSNAAANIRVILGTTPTGGTGHWRSLARRMR